MNRKSGVLIPLFLFLMLMTLNPLNLTLKAHGELSGGAILLKNIVQETLPPELGNIEIKTPERAEIKLTAQEIMEQISGKAAPSLSLTGDYILLRNSSMIDTTDDTSEPFYGSSPLEQLRKHLASFIDTKKFTIEIAALRTVPECDLTQPAGLVHWEIPIIQNGLQDINRYRHLFVNVDGRQIRADLDIKLFATVYVAKEKQKKDDLFVKEKYNTVYCDLTSVAGFENLVYNTGENRYTMTKAVASGDFLRWDMLARIPDIVTGERVMIRITRNGIDMTFTGTALQDSVSGKTIAVKTDAGQKLFGTVRITDEGKFVEIN